MIKGNKLDKFIEMMSNRSNQLSLSYSDFLPLEEIIDYKSIMYEEGLSNVVLSDICRTRTKRIVMSINVNSKTSSIQIKKIIEFIRSQFENDIDILLGSSLDETTEKITINLVLYEN
jgi:cell division GTPase FtsZ